MIVNPEIYIGWGLGSDYSGSIIHNLLKHGQRQSSKVQTMRETISTEATFTRRLEPKKKH